LSANSTRAAKQLVLPAVGHSGRFETLPEYVKWTQQLIQLDATHPCPESDRGERCLRKSIIAGLDNAV
jgi:hypothetical protein